MCARLTSHAERYDVIILDLASWRGQISCPVVQELRLPSRVCYFPQILPGKTSSSIACYWGCKYQVCWSVRAEEIIIYLSTNLMEINCFSNSNLTVSHLENSFWTLIDQQQFNYTVTQICSHWQMWLADSLIDTNISDMPYWPPALLSIYHCSKKVRAHFDPK